jgi:thioredoxin-like negative regulator of GroEL
VGDQAAAVVLVSFPLILMVFTALLGLLLNGRALAAMRAVGVLNDLSVAQIRELVGDPAPESADDLARRLDGRTDGDALAALASWLVFEGRTEEASQILSTWAPADPGAAATKARIEAARRLMDGDDTGLPAAEAATATIPDSSRAKA